MTSALSAKFHLPPQDLDSPQLFAANCDAAKAWLAALPKTNIGQSTRALHSAIIELNRVRMTPALRLQLLEELRPSIYVAGQGLRRHYLNQTIELPAQAEQEARLAHALHEQLATGYILAAAHMLDEGERSGSVQFSRAFAIALHRAIVDYSQNLLRDYQLYRNPHPGCWATLHRLAALAREQGVWLTAIADAECGDSTPETAYLRAVLLGSSNPNQLRQEQLATLFQHALPWAAAVTMVTPDKALLVVDPDGDEGPYYREFAEIGRHWLGFDTAPLAQILLAQAEQAENQNVRDQQPPAELLRHLAYTWSTPLRRNQVRMDVNETIEVTLGLTATHHFVSGGIDFKLLLNAEGHAKLAAQEENVFLRPKSLKPDSRSPHDVWSSPYEPGLGAINVSIEALDFQMREQYQKLIHAKERKKFQRQQVTRINVSPNGLCITWPSQSHVQLRNGEVVGVRDKALNCWSVGVVRWVRLAESGPRLGIELLSPTAVPYGGRVINRAGDPGEYLRVLVLPEIPQIKQPATLLAPRLPFRTGQKVSLLRNGEELRVQLTRKINSTVAFKQFEFRRLGAYQDEFAEPPANIAPHASDFDGLRDIPGAEALYKQKPAVNKQ